MQSVNSRKQINRRHSGTRMPTGGSDGDVILDRPSETSGSTRKTMASKVTPSESNGTRGKQVNAPELDSNALHRRAKELSIEIQQESVVDNEKVDRIKREIEEGTYEVDAEAIATKLLETDALLDD